MVMLGDDVCHAFLFRWHDSYLDQWQTLLNLVPKRCSFCLKLVYLIVIQSCTVDCHKIVENVLTLLLFEEEVVMNFNNCRLAPSE